MCKVKTASGEVISIQPDEKRPDKSPRYGKSVDGFWDRQEQRFLRYLSVDRQETPPAPAVAGFKHRPLSPLQIVVHSDTRALDGWD